MFEQGPFSHLDCPISDYTDPMKYRIDRDNLPSQGYVLDKSFQDLSRDANVIEEITEKVQSYIKNGIRVLLLTCDQEGALFRKVE